MITFPPACAIAWLIDRPRRRAAPVTRIVSPSRGLEDARLSITSYYERRSFLSMDGRSCLTGGGDKSMIFTSPPTGGGREYEK